MEFNPSQPRVSGPPTLRPVENPDIKRAKQLIGAFKARINQILGESVQVNSPKLSDWYDLAGGIMTAATDAPYTPPGNYSYREFNRTMGAVLDILNTPGTEEKNKAIILPLLQSPEARIFLPRASAAPSMAPPPMLSFPPTSSSTSSVTSSTLPQRPFPFPSASATPSLFGPPPRLAAPSPFPPTSSSTSSVTSSTLPQWPFPSTSASATPSPFPPTSTSRSSVTSSTLPQRPFPSPSALASTSALSPPFLSSDPRLAISMTLPSPSLMPPRASASASSLPPFARLSFLSPTEDRPTPPPPTSTSTSSVTSSTLPQRPLPSPSASASASSLTPLPSPSPSFRLPLFFDVPPSPELDLSLLGSAELKAMIPGMLKEVRLRLNDILRPLNCEINRFGNITKENIILMLIDVEASYAELMPPDLAQRFTRAVTACRLSGYPDQDVIQVFDAFLRLPSPMIFALKEGRADQLKGIVRGYLEGNVRELPPVSFPPNLGSSASGSSQPPFALPPVGSRFASSSPPQPLPSPLSGDHSATALPRAPLPSPQGSSPSLSMAPPFPQPSPLDHPVSAPRSLPSVFLPPTTASPTYKPLSIPTTTGFPSSAAIYSVSATTGLPSASVSLGMVGSPGVPHPVTSFTPSSPPLAPSEAGGEKEPPQFTHVVRFNFTATDPNKISVKKGEKLILPPSTQEHSSDWTLVQNASGKRGWVPTLYIEELGSGSRVSRPPRTMAPSPSSEEVALTAFRNALERAEKLHTSNPSQASALYLEASQIENLPIRERFAVRMLAARVIRESNPEGAIRLYLQAAEIEDFEPEMRLAMFYGAIDLTDKANPEQTSDLYLEAARIENLPLRERFEARLSAAEVLEQSNPEGAKRLYLEAAEIEDFEPEMRLEMFYRAIDLTDKANPEQASALYLEAAEIEDFEPKMRIEMFEAAAEFALAQRPADIEFAYHCYFSVADLMRETDPLRVSYFLGKAAEVIKETNPNQAYETYLLAGDLLQESESERAVRYYYEAANLPGIAPEQAYMAYLTAGSLLEASDSQRAIDRAIDYYQRAACLVDVDLALSFQALMYAASAAEKNGALPQAVGFYLEAADDIALTNQEQAFTTRLMAGNLAKRFDLGLSDRLFLTAAEGAPSAEKAYAALNLAAQQMLAPSDFPAEDAKQNLDYRLKPKLIKVWRTLEKNPEFSGFIEENMRAHQTLMAAIEAKLA